MPKWVANPWKYGRAKEELADKNAILKASGKPELEITEERIKEVYVRLLGLVREVPETLEETVSEAAEVTPTPKKRGRPSA